MNVINEESKVGTPNFGLKEEEHVEISNEDLRDLFGILKSQKEGLQVLNDSVNKSARELTCIEKELNNL